MCNAFAFIMTRNGTCYWKAGTDSHDALFAMFKDKDVQLRDISSVQAGPYCQGEYVPANGDYLAGVGWHFDWYAERKPEWWGYDHEVSALKAFDKWRAEVYGKINIDEVRNPVHPFKIEPPEITADVLALLKEWASVGGSLGDSVWASVGSSVGASLGGSVWDSVGDSVWNSVWARVGVSLGDSAWARVWASVGSSAGASCYAYIGSLFDIWPDGYPHECGAKLWRMGLVPSYDGETWRLHGGPDGRVLWEGTIGGGW